MMTTYKAHHAGMPDPTIRYEILDGRIVTFERKSVFLASIFGVGRRHKSGEFPLDRSTEVVKEEIYSEAFGYFEFKTGVESKHFFVHENPSEFIAAVKRQVRK